MKPVLILTHLGTLAVGAVAATLLVPSLRSPKNSGSSENGVSATTFIAGVPDGGSSGDLSVGSLSSVSLEQSGYRMGREDPLAALAAAKSIPGRENRQVYTEAVYTAWGEKNGQEAVEWVMANLKGVERADALYYIADGWGESDPAAAAAWFNENTSGTNREDAIYEILESWGRKAPQDALAWAESLDEYTRSSVMDSLASGWASHDPQGAAKAAEQLMDHDFGDEFVMSIAGQWANSNPAEAANWAATLKNEDARAIAFMEIGTEWGMSDPSKAAAWLATLQTAEDKSYAALGIAQGWAEHDPGSSLKWAVASVDDPETRLRIIEDVMLDWSYTDPSAAAEWLNAQPKGPQNDEVLATFSGAIIDLDPESALTWASTISDEAKRNENLQSLIEQWIAMDEDEAREWISKSQLSPDIKAKFGGQN